ncbi:hypothetical protein [Cohaesibacter celericrescens]|nr:hypothetical protein [Cohaesibacter celericrescens]
MLAVQVPHPERWAFRSSQPVPYADASYFSKDFIRESMNVIRVRHVEQDSPDDHLFEIEDVQGKWFNVKNGLRVTTDQPTSFQTRIILMGSSQIFGQEVPDDQTAASHLQRLLNREFPNRFKVENWGLVAINSRQQLERLKKAQIDAGAIVLFCGKSLDSYYGLLEKNVLGYSPYALPADISRMSWFGHFAHEARAKLPFLAMFRLFNQIQSQALPAHLSIEQEKNALLALVSKTYGWNEFQAAQYVTSRRAHFVNVEMPLLYDYPKQTDYRNKLLTNPVLFPLEFSEAHELARPHFHKTIEELKGLGVPSKDISPRFIDATKDKEVFLDPGHFNHVGAEAIAESLNGLVRQIAFGSPQRLVRHKGASQAFGRLPEPERFSLSRLDENNTVYVALEKRYQLYHKDNGYFAIPEGLGYVWWKGVTVADLPGVLVAPSRKALVDQLLIHYQSEPQS